MEFPRLSYEKHDLSGTVHTSGALSFSHESILQNQVIFLKLINLERLPELPVTAA